MNEYIVEMENINKSFSGVPVLKNVRFTLKAGEVMALLGENGAGKSTLMKILSGVYVRDSGTMKIFGEEQGDLDTKKAQELGVAIIHQELNMCRHLTVAENIFLGREVRKGVTLNNREMVKRTQEVLDSLKIDLSPNTVVGDLPVSKQQMVEIAKALSVHAKILIMDEPTSALSSKEIDELFRLVDQLRSEGCGIVYISHRMEELSHVANRVTVMRDGEFIMEGNFADYTMDQLIAKMVGRDIKEKFPRVQCQRGEKILEVKNLNAGRMVRDVSFDLYAGEIVGIAGLVGAGRTETTRAIFGIDPKDSGEIVLDGKSVSIKKPIDAIKAGIVLTPEDRKRDGLCTKLGVRENLSIPNLDWLSNGIGKVNQKKEREIADKVVEELQIKLSSVEINAESLSGGNQQKVVIGKWLARNSRVIMFDEPTRGVDVGAKVEIYNLMNRLKQQGTGVLFVSSELPEILGISDRILVMCDGHLTGELPVAEATEDKILSYATAFESKI
ncbi:Galactose/methyl galactoside import ATP-binding protein MglA [anaerobic digester metagenome]|jgi:ribose transport system ATP-binding protein|uniref:sugar ABC transporter ATP-binding protein n=1 Tax=Oscillibacter ruminantium TaxID=1263547 RepID=UPI0002E70853|nr:sugar ABC transporter ATP-binding protein [Oscillibacter ruminantium]MEA5042544.1 sugar ABC transporter ATP-binding protein [Oscillibacter ruminantium]